MDRRVAGDESGDPRLAESWGWIDCEYFIYFRRGGNRHPDCLPARKGAVRIMAKTAAVRYAPEGIRVNLVHPVPVDTPMTSDFDCELWQMYVNSVPL